MQGMQVPMAAVKAAKAAEVEALRIPWSALRLEAKPFARGGGGQIFRGRYGANAVAASALEAFHADPADRFIVATALARGATLLTADEAILAWPGPLRSQAAGR